MAREFRVLLSPGLVDESGRSTFPGVDLRDVQSIESVSIEVLPRQAHPMFEIEPTMLRDVDALILHEGRLTARSLTEHNPVLVARVGAGYDTVDVTAATERAVTVTTAPDGIRRPLAVAELSLILDLSLRFREKELIARSGPDAFVRRGTTIGTGLSGKTLGTLGLGGVATELLEIARPLGMEYIACSPRATREQAELCDVSLVSIGELFERSDFLVINCPLNADTRGLVTADLLGRMKATSYFINAARGEIVDQPALINLLRSRGIAGAALDVQTAEPIPLGDPLLELDNVILTPHSLCWTDECFDGIWQSTVRSVKDAAAGILPTNAINPEAWRRPTVA